MAKYSQKAIIFGSNGQDGIYLSKFLLSKGLKVYGFSRSSIPKVDVSNFDMVCNVIKESKPDYIFHFAANSTTRHEALFENHASISTGTLNILESVKLFSKDSKVFISGSAVQFDNKGLPISESTSFKASSPYAISRIQATYSARYYRDNFGLNTYVGYLFNHDSPLRTVRHVNQKIITELKKIKNCKQGKLEIGNISVKKEYNYAGDIINAIWIFMNQDAYSECILGNGLAYSIEYWTRLCCLKLGLVFEDVVSEKMGFTPEYSTLVSDPSRIKSLGWMPYFDIEQLADIMISGIDSNLK